MELTIDRKILKEVVSNMRSSLDHSGVKPILKHFLFEVSNQHLTIKATNGTIATTWTTQVDTPDDFSFTMLGETLGGIVSSLDKDRVVFTYSPETDDIVLKCGKYLWEGISGNTSSFPGIALPENLNHIALPTEFGSMLKKVFFSISKDVEKADLNSLCLDINKDNSGKISLVSTDRIRLSFAHSPLNYDNDKGVRFVIPKNSVSEIIKMAPSGLFYDDEMKKIYFKTNTLTGVYVFQSILTHVEYPDIYVYLDQDFNENPVIFPKNEFIKVLKRIKLTSDKTSREGNISFTEKEAVITSLSSSHKSRETVEVSYTDNIPPEFNINLDYLLEYLSLDEEEKIEMKVIEGKCVVFDKTNYRHVLSIHN